MLPFRSDWVKVYDGENEEAPTIGGDMCGYDPPSQIVSTSNQLLVKFNTDDRGLDTGFRIKIENGMTIFQVQNEQR